MAPYVTPWTEEKIKKLKELAETREYSCAQMATALGGGLTRNAVIGKIHRMGMKEYLRFGGERTAMMKKRATDRARLKKAAIEAGQPQWNRTMGTPTPPKPLPKNKALPGAPLPFRDAAGHLLDTRTVGRGQCRYTYGDPQEADFHYCGAAVKNSEKQWCDFHRNVVYTPALARAN